MKVLRHNQIIKEYAPPYKRATLPTPPTPDEELLRRCLDYLVEQLGAVDGELIRDLRKRLGL